MKGHLAGSRIRARRLALGIKQGALAEAVQISPAYLNLIEHNRRRIGGATLVRLATQLGVDPAFLADGAQSDRIRALKSIAAEFGGERATPPGADDLAEMFPQWAEVILGLHGRNQAQARTVSELSDRLAHDPQLAASLHEVLSVVTAIRSTAGILQGDDTIEPDWQARFHRNLYEDSDRLAGSARALVDYLDASARGQETLAGDQAAGPEVALDGWLNATAHRFDGIEADPHDPAPCGQAVEQAVAAGADRAQAAQIVKRYAHDAAALPLAVLKAAMPSDADPMATAQATGAPLDLVLRRLAIHSRALLGVEAGLAVCDTAGVISYRKPIDDFMLPRHSAGCPLWPLYQAQTRPGQAIRMPMTTSGYVPRTFLGYAIAVPKAGPAYGAAAVFEATMLVVPEATLAGAFEPNAQPLEVGPGCRICPRTACEARHAPSVVRDGEGTF